MRPLIDAGRPFIVLIIHLCPPSHSSDDAKLTSRRLNESAVLKSVVGPLPQRAHRLPHLNQHVALADVRAQHAAHHLRRPDDLAQHVAGADDLAQHVANHLADAVAQRTWES